LPVIADPSHGIGIRSHISKIALAAMVAGADGIITEIHHEPEKAFSDGQQTLSFEEFDALLIQLRKIHKVLH
jgi:3-deoxy-7-phosphoheptulonate synthase